MVKTNLHIHSSCFFYLESGTVTRTCDLLPINDCKTANGVQYCYCNTPLCNLRQGYSTASKQNHILTDDNTDDEDIIGDIDEEASGSYGNENIHQHRHDNNNDDYDGSLTSTEIINRKNSTPYYRKKTSSFIPSSIDNSNNRSSSSNSNKCYSINFSRKISSILLIIIIIQIF